ncbi:Maf family protein [Proteiniclasticum ruminis]|uniref:dTTP/UTP pyrophosphatase n=1 Tax=Proteiniclasticum ruminis TaxID=398199 RepID=A0A1G8NHG2_9CLOT|nr:Maf family protein [Proteiniclasticum ruminis]SDI79598.1 septum formation protein [Proteiniclasticum ruminis]
MHFVLASASLRRQELLQRMNIPYEIIVSDFDEDTVPFEGNPEYYVKKLAEEKANSVSQVLSDDAVVIGADTIVFADGQILGKPKSREDAKRMMKMLQGTSHFVYSGVALIHPARNLKTTFSVVTTVSFSEMDDEEIEFYLAQEEWQDKAGAYGIQGAAGIYIREIHGDFYNVMGLPLQELYTHLRKYSYIM